MSLLITKTIKYRRLQHQRQVAQSPQQMNQSLLSSSRPYVPIFMTTDNPRSINGSAKVAGEARAALRDLGVKGLITQPMN